MNEERIKRLQAHFETKSEVKQQVYRQTKSAFDLINKGSERIIQRFRELGEEKGSTLDLSFQLRGSFESELMFAGDALSIQMHTNVFAFPDDHFLQKTITVQADPDAGYCGMILVYNFLADSLRYNRAFDLGYLMARIFVNKDAKFFVQGRRQLGFLYQDFDAQVFSEEVACEILEKIIAHAIDFDLYVPPFDTVKEVSLQQKTLQQGNTAIKTGKRLGFVYDFSETDSEN